MQPNHISVQSLHSRALPAVTNLSFLSSRSIKSPDEGNDSNRESHEDMPPITSKTVWTSSLDEARP